MTRANPCPPSGFDGWVLVGPSSLLPTSNENCVTATCLLSRWRCGRPLWLECLYLEVSRTIVHRATCELKTWEMCWRQLSTRGVQARLSECKCSRSKSYLSIDLTQEMHKEVVGKTFGRFMPGSLSKYFSLSLSFGFFLSTSPSFLFSREKYINIILKMEEMLKSWFPNVKLQGQLAVTQTEEAVPAKKLKVKLCKKKKRCCCVRTVQLGEACCQGHMVVTQWKRD